MTTYTTIAISPEVRAWLPDVNVFAAHLKVQPHQPSPKVDSSVAWEQLHQLWRGKSKKDVAKDASIAAYRDFYETIGLNPSKTPPSMQNLIQRFLIKEELRPLPRIHPIVDVVNLAAVETRTSLGVFDSRSLVGDISLTLSNPGETFWPIGADREMPLPEKCLVLRDREKMLSQFCYRDADSQKITASTSQIWLLGCLVPGIDQSDLLKALDCTIHKMSELYTIEIV